MSMEKLKIAYPTDEHYPYQDERARSVALQIVRDFDPDVRISGSDGVDFYQLSRYDKHPERITGLQADIDLWQRGQREWRSASPRARAWFLMGNHEDRLQSYIFKHPELYKIEGLKIQNLLGLANVGAYWEKDKPEEQANRELVIYSRLVIRHGSVVRKHSAYTARAEMEREASTISVMTGHTHRGGSHYQRTRRGLVMAQECFCLCGLEPPYARQPNWQQGIALATVTADYVSIEAVPFQTVQGKVTGVWRGKEYRES